MYSVKWVVVGEEGSPCYADINISASNWDAGS